MHRSLLIWTLAAGLAASGCSAETTLPQAQGPVVRVSPPSATLLPGGTQAFTATVTGTASMSVTWRVVEATGGTVDATGHYVAPASPGTFHVTATASDNVTIGQATVSVVTPAPPSGTFVTGYYAHWQQDWLPLANIRWRSLTHIILHSGTLLRPTTSATDASNPYASINSGPISFNVGTVRGPAAMSLFASTARAHGAKALLGFGGMNSTATWEQVADPANRTQFVSDVVAACNAWGFDGLDVDWEPMPDADQPLLLGLVQALRAAKPDMVISIAADSVNANQGMSAGRGAFWASVAPYVDQINPMIYTANGPWGWDVWHNCPLFGHYALAPLDVASNMAAYLPFGVPKAKLGAGIGLYGYGVGPAGGGGTAALRQPYPPSPFNSNANDGELALHNIMLGMYDQGGAVDNWDDVAKAAYLTWPAPGFHPTAFAVGGNFTFLSYESVQSITEKGTWLAANGYGGAMLWTLNEGTLVGYESPVLDALALSLLGRSGL